MDATASGRPGAHTPFSHAGLEDLQCAARQCLNAEDFDARRAGEIADALERLEAWECAWAIWGRIGRARKPLSPLRDLPDWDRGPLIGRRLIVERRMRHIGAELRMARLFPRVIEAGGDCLAYVDPRAASLYRRSFPAVDVRIRADTSAAGDVVGGDQVASLEDLGAVFTPDRDAVIASWRPLVADPRRVERMRALLASPAVGVSWASANHAKHLPDPHHWARLMNAMPGSVLSLQYSPATFDLALFHALCDRFRHDVSMDPFHDLEGHAAQIAAVDVVVTISNTAAHMAGALGRPCVVILDDAPIGIWPITGDRAAWYPSLRLVRRRFRPWPEVMAQAAAVARDLIGVN